MNKFKIASENHETGLEIAYIKKFSVSGEDWVLHYDFVGLCDEILLYTEDFKISHYKTGYGLNDKQYSKFEKNYSEETTINNFITYMESLSEDRIKKMQEKIRAIKILNE